MAIITVPLTINKENLCTCIVILVILYRHKWNDLLSLNSDHIDFMIINCIDINTDFENEQTITISFDWIINAMKNQRKVIWCLEYFILFYIGDTNSWSLNWVLADPVEAKEPSCYALSRSRFIYSSYHICKLRYTHFIEYIIV